MPFATTVDVERYDEAANWFLGLKVVTGTEHAALVQGAYHQAFWVGAGLQVDEVQRVFTEIGKAIESGEPFAEWRERVRKELWNDAHAETVFRNAVQRAYNAGRYEQMRKPEVLRFRPFWLYDSILDDRTTEVCKICNGTLLPADDPFWQSHVPPLHHRCRSSIRNLRRSEAERRGISPKAPDTDKLKAPGEWGLAPSKSEGWKPPKGKYDRDLDKELRKKGKKAPPAIPKPKGKRKAAKKAAPSATHTLDAETAQTLLEALGNGRDGEGKDFREWLRGGLLEHAGATPGMPNLGLDVAPAWLPKTANAAVLLGGPQRGLVGVRVGRYSDARQALQTLAKGESIDGVIGRTGPLADSLKTLLHEEIHAAGKASPLRLNRSEPWNLFVEESTTELLAQRTAARVGAYKEPLRITAEGRFNRAPSYGLEIATMLHDVATATGWSYDDALERITDASAKMRGPVPSGNGHLDDFLDALDTTPDAKRSLRAALLRRKLFS
jgi:SPP1 gp7 family putative phage head morphogenesis protein